jgi:hypothetical protein
MPFTSIHSWIKTAALFIFSITPLMRAEEVCVRIDTLYVESQTLIGDLCIRHLMDKKTIKGLEKGMTAVIEYRMQIWREQNRWMKSLIYERFRRMKINYNHWERKYQIYLHNDKSRLLEETDLIVYCQEVRAFKIVDIQMLTEGERYRVVAQVLFKPMSMENIRELKRWLSGEADKFNPHDIKISKSPWKKAGDWLLNVFVNLSGFGDRIFTDKTPFFYRVDNRILLEETF